MDKSESNPGGLSLALLGAYQIIFNHEPLGGLSSDKIRGVLAYLVVGSDRPHRRSFLAEMFWPDRPSSVARGNLKQAIAILRKVLGDRDAPSPYLLVSRNNIQFNVSSHYWLDLSDFTEALDASKNHGHRRLESCEKCAESLLHAVELYRGDFLSEFFLPGSRGFEEWAAIRREAFQRQTANALRLLTTHSEQRGELEAAREYGRRLVNHELWSEGNHRVLMRILAITGRRSEALRQFKTCRRILRDEFDAAPADETLALYQQIQDGQIETLKTTPVAAQAEQEAVTARGGPRWLRYSALGVGATALIAMGVFGLRSLGILGEAPPGEIATSTPSQALPQDLILSTIPPAPGGLQASTPTDQAAPTEAPTSSPSSTPMPIPYALSVLVTGEGDVPISGAFVTLDGVAGENGTQLTNDLGIVSWSSVPRKIVYLSISAQGYLPTEASGIMGQGDSQVSISLERDPYGILPSEACAPGERLLYIEDFQDGEAQGWPEIEYRAQEWAIASDPDNPGDMVLSRPSTTEHGSASLRERTFDNAVWRLAVRLSGTSESYLGWHLREQPYETTAGRVEWSAYSIWGGGGRPGMHAIRDAVPLSSVSLRHTFHELEAGHWHQIEISTYEGRFELWLDGLLWLRYDDPEPLPGGTIQIGVTGGDTLDNTAIAYPNVYYNDFVVCELNAPFVPMPTPISE